MPSSENWVFNLVILHYWHTIFLYYQVSHSEFLGWPQSQFWVTEQQHCFCLSESLQVCMTHKRLIHKIELKHWTIIILFLKIRDFVPSERLQAISLRVLRLGTGLWDSHSIISDGRVPQGSSMSQCKVWMGPVWVSGHTLCIGKSPCWFTTT